MLPPILFSLRRPIVLALHLALIPLGYYVAFVLRFDFDLPEPQRDLFWRTLPYVLVLRLALYAAFGLFHGWWRHVGMRDLIDLVRATTLSSGLLLAALFFTADLGSFPRSVLFLDWAAALLLFGGVRFGVRALREERLVPFRPRSGARTLIIGAGAAAERLVREMQRGSEAEMWPVVMVDDDPAKKGMRLHGVPVLGTRDDLPELVERFRIQRLVIAIPSAARQEMRPVVEACLQTGLEFKIVPSMREMLDGHARIGELRKVEIEDLLGREAIELGLDGPRRDLEGSTVLVTGGAGSIGSELARQIAGLNPSRLVVLDQAESPLYFTNLELRAAHPGLEVVPIVADITDQARVESVFARYRPRHVFHAAAYKHVPLMEDNPVEAVRNNVLGTLAVAQAAARYGAQKFVLISTDKAVHPSSVMGATKRLAEQITLGWPGLRDQGCDFRAVRFGNVLGSDGSVIPLFKKQLAAGQPITVTHPDVTRYFMTIPEAVQLVLQAAALPDACGHISMLEMGEPVRIVDLAENLIRLSGLEPYTDVDIQFTGLRPGEKLHEELMSDLENTVPTAVEKIRVVQTAEPDTSTLTRALDRLGAAVAVGNADDIVGAVRALVPECVPPLSHRGMLAAEVD
jgi:FlaA1/EpsC-like NDP-sugar epimerase